ncbi:TPA: polysaccharide pyruvyl transferase family protein [Providencia alcalifaciens]
MKQKKVGILNFQYSDHNYGAVLQAAALENVVKQLGYNAEHINYIPYNNGLKNRLKKSFFGHLVKVILGKSSFFNYVTNQNAFENFRQEWITRTPISYHTSSDLDDISSNYNAIIVGSDQVWRQGMHSTPTDTYAYYLQFASDTTLRISYAASFGVDYWETSENQQKETTIKNSILKFDSISVRESSGVDICAKQFNKKAEHVLDPTLLVDKAFFERIISSIDLEKNSNIVYYKLDVSNTFTEQLTSFANKTNLSLENIYFTKEKFFNKYIPVNMWLYKIKNSDLVITDSFHCVCFSIIFNKDFLCIRNKKRGESRLYSLLNILNLESKLIDENELDCHLKNYSAIDYSSINKILDNKKESSIEFLKKSLQPLQRISSAK